MSELLMAESAWTLIAKQKIMPNDVILLRQDAFPNGVQTPNDVATLLALETACDVKCPQWDNFFINSITNYMVHKSAPLSIIDDAQSDWLRCSVTRNGIIDTKNECELLIKILEEAKSGPSDLCSLVLDHICRLVYASRSEAASNDISSENENISIWLKRLIAVANKFSVHEKLRAQALLETLREDTRSTGTSDFVKTAQKMFNAA